jgi:hypothetical protein
MNADKVAATAIIQALPWAELFTTEQVINYVDYIAAQDPTRVVWHAKRMLGFGASEMGGLVADYINTYEKREFDTPPRSFSSAREVVESKLLIDYTMQKSGHLDRGTDFEDIIRDRFVKQLQARGDNVSRDRDIIAKLANVTSKAKPELAWLKGNIDDALVVDGKLYIVDYKYPKPGNAEDSRKKGVSFDYKVQLECYGLLAAEEGIKVDGFILAPFDFEHYKAFDVMFESDPKLVEQIKKAGKLYYNEYLLKGKTPDFVNSYEYLSDPKLLSPESRHISDQIAVLSQLSSQAKEAADSLRDELKTTIFIAQPEPDTRFQLGLLNATYKEKKSLNKEKLISLAKSLNVDLEKFETGRTINYKLLDLYEHLKVISSNGYPVDFSDVEIIESDVSLRLSGAKKGAIAELKQGVYQGNENLIEGYLSMMREDLKELDPIVLNDLVRNYNYHENRIDVDANIIAVEVKEEESKPSGNMPMFSI